MAWGYCPAAVVSPLASVASDRCAVAVSPQPEKIRLKITLILLAIGQKWWIDRILKWGVS
jgi:hypothetical protein